MHLGWWFRRIAAATAVTLGLGLAAGDGAALGVELPSVEPALGAETTLPGVSDLPSTSVLPIDPQQPIGPTLPATPISPTSTAPAGPSGPSGSVSPSGSPTSAQAAVRSGRRGSLPSTGRSRNLVNGDRRPTPRASGTGSQRIRRAAAAGRRDRPRRRGLSSSSPGFQLFHPSQLEHLGRVLAAPDASPPRFLDGFSASATGGAGWAPPLLTIMLLIGLGGFLRVATSTPRHNP